VRLADFILDQLEPILQEWEDFARTVTPAGQSMSIKELRNHASIMLTIIAADLRRPQTRDEEIRKSQGLGPTTIEHRAGVDHGIARLESNFTIEQLVSEYRALRSSVLRLWGDSNQSVLPSDIGDITRFNEAIDHLLAASIFSFAQQAKQAQETEQQRRDQFLAMLAHELRNPLAPISAAATLLKLKKEDDALVTNASTIITRQVTHLVELVDDLLDVSRVTRGLIELKHEALDVRRIVADAVEQVTPQMQARHHQLTVAELIEPVIVFGDSKRLVQVLTNLLSNAAKYTPPQGHIRLMCELSDKQVAVSVEDDGIGMAAEFVPHAFDLFAQAERTSDRSSGGLGLGLALVKNLVELHGGKVVCSSPGMGRGSCFTVFLPRQFGQEQEIERRRESRTRLSTTRPLKIVIVDDNADAAHALGLLLETVGHQVIIAHSAQSALEVIGAEHPDACLLDIGLPDMDGKTLARRLRAQPETANTPLIAVTGYGQPHDREEAIAAGFDGHMTKPVDVHKLLRVLAAI
jgi:signal transduction histidine kinase